eukprot:7757408-Alexandrium_andersonii.AAC.1
MCIRDRYYRVLPRTTAYCGVLPRTTAYYGGPARPARQAARRPRRVLWRTTAYYSVLRQARSTSPAGRPAAAP